jgi:hypothetical protein
MVETQPTVDAVPAAGGVIADRLSALSADELLEELRARVAAGADGNGRSTAAGPAPSRADLREVDSAAIAARLKAVQRQRYRPDSGRYRPAAAGTRSIYGGDDRLDLYQVTDPRLRADAECVAILVHQNTLTDNGNGTSRLRSVSFRSQLNLCTVPPEPFLNQPVLGQTSVPFGSGFLVAPDVIATAAHCIDGFSLPAARFVFGFQMKDATTATVNVKHSDVYRCVALIGHHFTEDAADWALVRLDRPVLDRHIASIRRSGKVADTQAVHVIGHPCELPLKVAGNAAITDNTVPTHFYATLDAYGGNSGSPVFNSVTHEVEGILVRGQTDFISLGPCNVSAVYPSTGPGGEEVTRTTQFASLLAPGWQQLDDNPLAAAIAAGSSKLYQLHRNGQLYQHTGTPMVGWILIDNNPLTEAVAADGSKLYQLHRNGQVYEYTNRPMTGWALIDTDAATAQLTATGGRLYKRRADGSIFRYSGTPGSWLQLDDNSRTVALADDGKTLYQLHNNGELYQYTNRPMTGWALIDDNPQTAAIAADGARLYQLHRSGELFRYTNTPMTGWAPLNAGPIDPSKTTRTIAAAGGRLYYREARGRPGQPTASASIWRSVG